MELTAGEHIIAEWDGAITLTNRRIRLREGSGSNMVATGITLEAISSCSIETVSNWWLLLAALASAAYGIANQGAGRGALIAGFGVSAACIVGFFLTRAELIRVTSANGAISRRTNGRSAADILQFIDKVEAAKLAVGGAGRALALPPHVAVDPPNEGAAASSGPRASGSPASSVGEPRRICSACEMPVGANDSVCPSCGNAGTQDL